MDRPNVILVVFDTARWDRVGCYGYPKNTTPTLDTLAREGLRAETMVPNAPWTLPSHASLFTGLYPTQHGAQWQTGPKLRPTVRTTMAEWFRSLGYETWCVTNNGMISDRTGLTRGFQEYASRLDLEKGWRRRWRRLDKVARGGDSGGRIVNRWMRDRLPRAKAPLFLFVNYLECHWSYAPPPRFVEQVGGLAYGAIEGMRYRANVAARAGPWETIARARPRDLDVLSTYYDGELANVDDHLGELLDILRGTGHIGHDGDALVIVTSDHGEHLGEQGLADHHGSLDDLLCRVPFIAWAPGVIRSGSVREPLAEFVDVLPSLAKFLDLDAPATYLDERRLDLFGPDRDGHGYAFSEWRSWTEGERERLAKRNPSYSRFGELARDLVSVRDQRWKLVTAADGGRRLFDLASDPRETTDVAWEQPDVAARLRTQLDGRIEEWASWESERAELTDEEQSEIERHLEDLGYI